MRMKAFFRCSRALKAVAGALLASAAFSFLFVPVSDAVAGDEIPARPDDLVFPSLDYDPPRAADYRVSLKGGMVAYMVPDRSLPLVTIHVLMRLGPDQDPAGKEGLGSIMVSQLTQSGTSTLSAEQLEDRVAQLGAQLSSSMGSGRRGMMGMFGIRTGPAGSSVTLNLLSKDLDAGLALLVDCLKEPAFQVDRLDLAREQAFQRMKERNDDTGDIERREWNLLMRGGDHWSNHWQTQASITAITRDDLQAHHQRYIGPSNFLLAVSGDFDRQDMKKKLEKTFADWPRQGEHPGPPAAPAANPEAGWFCIDKDVNQARVSFGLPAIDRYDPDWYAAQIMNDILGGGGFSSRLVNRIRSDEGLAYSVRSSLGSSIYYADPWRVGFQTKVRSTAYAIEIALAEIARMRDEPVTEEELALAKNNNIESLPTRFETSSAIARALVLEEFTGRWQRDSEYYVEYRDRIAAVTLADVQRVAQRLLDPAKLSFLIVGDVDEALLGDPKHEASLTDLSGGKLTRLPLRDPLSMEAMGN